MYNLDELFMTLSDDAIIELMQDAIKRNDYAYIEAAKPLVGAKLWKMATGTNLKVTNKTIDKAIELGEKFHTVKAQFEDLFEVDYFDVIHNASDYMADYKPASTRHRMGKAALKVEATQQDIIAKLRKMFIPMSLDQMCSILQRVNICVELVCYDDDLMTSKGM